MDGTILNTLDDLAFSMNYSLTQNNLPNRTLDEVRRFVGNGIRKLIERACPDKSDIALIDKVEKDFKSHYSLHCADKTHPYKGITQLIQSLRENGCKTAVVSNKADYAVQELCKKYFYGLFDIAIGEKKGIRPKPYPDTVYEAMKQLDCDPLKTVFIGDSDVDYNTAKNAHIDCIMVDWGFRDRKSLEDLGANCILSSTEELKNYLFE